MMKTKENVMDIRTKPFTASEFRALPRYENGRLKNMPEAFAYLTPKQVEMLHEDDWSYYQELQEELAEWTADELAYLA